MAKENTEVNQLFATYIYNEDKSQFDMSKITPIKSNRIYQELGYVFEAGVGQAIAAALKTNFTPDSRQTTAMLKARETTGDTKKTIYEAMEQITAACNELGRKLAIKGTDVISNWRSSGKLESISPSDKLGDLAIEFNDNTKAVIQVKLQSGTKDVKWSELAESTLFKGQGTPFTDHITNTNIWKHKIPTMEAWRAEVRKEFDTYITKNYPTTSAFLNLLQFKGEGTADASKTVVYYNLSNNKLSIRAAEDIFNDLSTQNIQRKGASLYIGKEKQAYILIAHYFYDKTSKNPENYQKKNGNYRGKKDRIHFVFRSYINQKYFY